MEQNRTPHVLPHYCQLARSPLVSRQVVVNLIGNTTTEAGLYIKSALDENHYDQGIKVSDDELATLAIERDGFHGEWNYRLRPKNQ